MVLLLTSLAKQAHLLLCNKNACSCYYLLVLTCMQEVASVLFSLANLAAHAHCLLRFAALLRRLARRGTSGVEAGSRGRSSISSAATNGGSRFDDDGGYSLGRPGSPQRAASSKQRGGDSSSSRGSGGTGGSSSGGAAPSRLGISPGLRLGSAVGSSAVGSGSSRPSLRQLNVAYPFWPLWLVIPCCFAPLRCKPTGDIRHCFNVAELTLLRCGDIKARKQAT